MKTFGDRMKAYEAVSSVKLMRRTPVIMRFDGIAFHTFTRGLQKPWDDVLMKAMAWTMRDLCANIQGCVFGYTQSDEITLVLTDYEKLTTDAWFDYRVQKMCSAGASMCSRFFNINFKKAAEECGQLENKVYARKFDKADFDCRVFNIPKEEVYNCVIWRQKDATKNSILGVAQSMFSQKEISGISCDALQDKLFTEKGVNWNDYPTPQKRGFACKKYKDLGWVIDEDIPILTQNRAYIEDLIYYEED